MPKQRIKKANFDIVNQRKREALYTLDTAEKGGTRIMWYIKRSKLALRLAAVSVIAAMTTTASCFPVNVMADTADDSAADTSWYQADASVYEIADAADLAGLAKLVNDGTDFKGKTIKQTADISLDSISAWTPIGSATQAFHGTYNGGGYEIKGMQVNTSAGYAGLFGNNGGTIEDLSVDGTVTDTSDKDFVGGVTGFNSGTIKDVHSDVQVSAGKAFNVGGIAGLSTSGAAVINSANTVIADAVGEIVDCSSTDSVTGYNKVGGIVGENAGTVRQSFTSGKVVGTNASSKNGVGGIAGRNGNNNTAYETGVITDCYSISEVGSTGQKWVGGITGFNNGHYGLSSKKDENGNLVYYYTDASGNQVVKEDSSVTNSYFAGTLAAGAGYTNAIVGQQEGKAANNYSLDTITNSGTAENEIGIQLTSDELKNAAEKLGTSFRTDETGIIALGYPALTWQQAEIFGDQNIGKTNTITKGGTYQIGKGATGKITVDTKEEVTLEGAGTDDGDVYSNLTVDCLQAGSNLNLKEVYLTNTDLEFTGADNTLDYSGTNILETSDISNPLVHVGADTELSISGGTQDVMYMYKSSQASGIGGKNGETNGKITFNGGNLFLKATKQGAGIGAGANASGTPGAITINGGTMNLIANARGAAMGGSAGTGGASGGSQVYLNGGKVNVNVDFSGAAIGGGGYASGNDSDGGVIHYNGGYLRTYIDQNAVPNWKSFGVSQAGVNNNAAVTADVVDDTGAELHLLAIDTSKLPASDTYKITKGDQVLYEGTTGIYDYVNSGFNKDTGEQIAITNTPSNWKAKKDSMLYVYVSGQEEDLKVNGVSYQQVKAVELENQSVTVGKSLSLKALVTPGDATNQDLIWTVSGNQSEKTVIKDGNLTVGADETAKTLKVQAMSAENGKIAAEAEITVQPKASGITVSTDLGTTSLAAPAGGKIQFQAAVSPADADSSVIWSVSGNKSNKTAISKDGLLTVGSDETSEKLQVTAVSASTGETVAHASVTVTGIKKSTAVPTVNITAPVVSNIKSKVYTGKALKQSVKVTLAGKKLKEGKDYTVSYKNNKKIGKATVIIRGKGTYSGTLSKTFRIVPKKAALSSVKKKGKKLTVKIRKSAGGVKYQIAYRKTGSKSWKKVAAAKRTKTISKLSAKGKYVVMVRAYKKVSGKTYYGSWSKSKKVS